MKAKENTLSKKNDRRAKQILELKREYALIRLNNKRWNEDDLEEIAERAKKLEAKYNLKLNFPGAYTEIYNKRLKDSLRSHDSSEYTSEEENSRRDT